MAPLDYSGGREGGGEKEKTRKFIGERVPVYSPVPVALQALKPEIIGTKEIRHH